ncbi:nipped-B-like protein A isoform X2 [Astyanax mexicanus]|uniref:nipped-B-like protein A isoform X2 n=1 Tax=Astyanax mexicanus TaxID=7994 RepID=UPI0020CAC932|nr:nipped-B-like protein A isoform X2 [Astyanax mexicanus]
MNGDMPHVPITTLAGIAGLTDLLNQLPLPSPLPGTTTKSLLYSVRVVEEVDRLLACRDDALVAQLTGGLAQVSTDHIELKDSLSSDELEGDVPVLLQLLLSRNPSIFRTKTSPTTPQYSAQTAGLAQPQMAPPFKMTHNAMQGSPATTNYQQGSITHSPSGRFVAGQTGSGGRFLPQQTSPVPSPYTPQSPVTGYRQFPHPPAYGQPQHLQPGSVASPMIPGEMRNPLESKDGMNFSGAPPLLQSSPPYTPPQEAELLLGSVEKGRGLKGGDGDKVGVYDMVDSPDADGEKVHMVRSRPAVEAELGGVFSGSDAEGELVEALAAIERMESEAAMETDRTAKEVQDKDKPLKKRKQDSHPQEPTAGGVGGVALGNRLAPVEGGALGGAEDSCTARSWPQEPQEGVTPKPLQRGNRQDDKKADAPRQKRRSDAHHDEGDASKPGELPAYELGENSGFKEPEGAGHVEVGTPLCWKQPRVCLERLETEAEPKKSVKPVVVLQKLSRDEVERLMKEKESRSKAKNRLTSGRYGKGVGDPSVLKDLPPELLAEIESTMPLCERVKMNKRKRSTVNERPRYAEDSSDEDGRGNADSARKRQKKDRDRTWEYEERDRRNSGEHRRGGGLHEGRRGRGSRYDDSEDDSPPPSLSEVARSLKKKEKEKKRKAYEPKLTAEEMMDSSTFKRFCNSIDNILENLEDVDFSVQDDDEIPQELLLGKQQLGELGSESAKIKAMGIMDRIPSDKLVKLLNILEKNILDGANLSTLMSPENDGEDEERLWRDLIMERVTKSADACLTSLNVMTALHMPKAVYMEDVIERLLQFTKFHLQNTLYPQYDPVYRVDPKGGSMLSSRAKRAKCSSTKQRVIIMLYNKVCDVVSNISELLEIQLMTDTTILQVSSMGITPFFVENVSELQLCAIRLVTAVFSRYEKHRQLILEEIFTSLARLPTSKRSLRNFRLNSSDDEGEPVYIQMVSALVLQLIQCVVHLPSDKDQLEDDHKKVDEDVLITNSYETARRTAQNFLSVFLKKCGSKQGEEDYRPLFENFVQDLLSTVNKPEWPASELLLSLLGRLLVHQFSNKQTEMALRVASLDYLGTVAARLRKDSVTSRMDQKAIDRILQESSGNDETQQLQKALLDYIDENAETDPALQFSRKFYIAQWFRDCTTECEKAMRTQKQDDSDGAQHAKELRATRDIMQRAEARKKFLHTVIKASTNQFTTLRMNSNTVDYDDACLIVRYLASTRPFSQSFDIYLTQILRVLGESAIAVRTKAMKCLSEVVAVDPSILARADMQRGVHGRLMDNSTSVREAAVELLGRFVLSRPQLTEQYYDMLIERILDTGISVRKRVIKILRDICLEQPEFTRITEMCVKMIRRVNDEEGIKKLVNETFQKLWFTPTPNHDKEAMNRKIINITDVVAACRDSGYDWFEQLLQNLLKLEEDSSYKPTRKACVQLVDNLVEYILKHEEALAEHKSVNSTRMVACITTLYLFSKIRAQLMVKHAMTMQPYLTTKCSSQSDFLVICNVAKILELVVPLMEHPSESFLTTIEEDLMKLIIKYGMTVVQHCVSCLGSVVNRVTRNYKFVWACFNRYYGALTKLKVQHQEGSASLAQAATKAALLRSLFTVGALCRHFDFDLEQFKGNTKIEIKEKVLELLLYFTNHEDEEVKCKAIIGLGFMFIMHPSQMFVPEVKTLYNGLLSEPKSSVALKIQVLKNLQMYLQEEDSRMQEADREWQKLSKQEDLKEMGDISSGMSSSIMQLYLKQVLEAFFHTQSSVRHFALNVIALTLSQGLIHPVQCVPYLIAMGTDPEPTMRNKADQQLVEIDKKYTGFIHMKAVAGMKMSFQVQQAVVGVSSSVIRGFRKDESVTALCSHLYSLIRNNRNQRRAFLISMLNLFDDSSKLAVKMLLFMADNLAYFPYQNQEEPLFIMHHIDITLSVSGSNLLQTFKESLVRPADRPPRKRRLRVRVKEPRREQEEKREEEEEAERGEEEEDQEEEEEGVVKVQEVQEHGRGSEAESESDSDLEDVEAVMERLPGDSAALLDFARASQGILLLLVLKQHLKNLYGFSDGKIQKYSPSESAKVYEKAVNRKSNVHFSPRQTIDFLSHDDVHSELTDDLRRKIVKQYLDFKLLMEHLDPDEEEEEGEASAAVRNKAITALLGGAGGGSSPRNHHPAESEEDDSEGEERAPGASRRGRRGAEALQGNLGESVSALDIVAIHRPRYRERPQLARVIQRTADGYSVQWLSGSYSSSWTEARRRDGRKLVPWMENIRESDIVYKKISLTSGNKLTHKLTHTLRSIYTHRDRTFS